MESVLPVSMLTLLPGAGRAAGRRVDSDRTLAYHDAHAIEQRRSPVSSILARIAAGDAEAVDECLDHYGGLVWSIARRLTPSPADAEDAVQEIFLDVWKSVDRFDERKASEKTFIAMIARRRLIDRLRHAERRPRLSPLPEGGPDPAGDQHLQIQRGAEAGTAQRALERLRPEQRRAIEMSVYWGMSHSEIATATSTPVGTIKSHIWRGLAAVRKILEEADEKGETTS